MTTLSELTRELNKDPEHFRYHRRMGEARAAIEAEIARVLVRASAEYGYRVTDIWIIHGNHERPVVVELDYED